MVSRKNTTSKIKEVKTLVDEALKHVTPENWRKAIQHTIKVEDAFRKVDFGDTEERIVERVVINLNYDSDSELNSDSDSDLDSDLDGFEIESD